MIAEQIHTLSGLPFAAAKAKAFWELLKFRLSLLVSFSCAFGYVLASPSVNWRVLPMLFLGGFPAFHKISAHPRTEEHTDAHDEKPQRELLRVHAARLLRIFNDPYISCHTLSHHVKLYPTNKQSALSADTEMIRT